MSNLVYNRRQMQANTPQNHLRFNAALLYELDGYNQVSLASGDVTFTAASTETRDASTIELTGSLSAARDLIYPAGYPFGHRTIVNATTGGYTVTVKVAGGAGVTVPVGEGVNVYSDGVNVYSSDAVGGVVDGQVLNDDDGDPSVDAGERTLLDADSNTIVDWTGTLNVAAKLSVDSGDGVLYGPGGVVTIDSSGIGVGGFLIMDTSGNLYAGNLLIADADAVLYGPGGFSVFGAGPVTTQPTAITNVNTSTGTLADCATAINAILAVLRNYGEIAT